MLRFPSLENDDDDDGGLNPASPSFPAVYAASIVMFYIRIDPVALFLRLVRWLTHRSFTL